MKRVLALLPAVFAALPFAGVPSALADDSLGAQYLFRFVPKSPETEFVSFAPEYPRSTNDLVKMKNWGKEEWRTMFWLDPPRTNAWLNRVWEKTGVRVSKIDIRPYTNSLVFRFDDQTPRDAFPNWATTCKAVSVVRIRKDDGTAVVRTNVFDVVIDDAKPMEDVQLKWRMPKSDKDFTLRVEQGIDKAVWAVTWDDLRGKWDSEIVHSPESVRGELWKLFDVLSKNTSSGHDKWKAKLLEYWQMHNSLWPKLVIHNSYVFNDKPVAVCISYRLEGRKDWSTTTNISANGEVLVDALADPYGPDGDGYRVEWKVRPDGLYCDECCRERTGKDAWPIKATTKDYSCYLSRDNKVFLDRPELEFGDSFVPQSDLRKEFSGLVKSKSVTVFYVGAEDGERESIREDSDRPPYIRVEPHRKVLKVVLPETDWFGAQDCVVTNSFHCGQRVQMPGTISRPSWPSVTIVPHVFDNDAADEDFSPKAEISIPDELRAGMSGIVNLVRDEQKTISLEDVFEGLSERPQQDGLEILLVVSANQFETATTNVVVGRGGNAIVWEPALKPISLPWPAPKSRPFAGRNMGLRFYKIFGPTETTPLDDVGPKEKYKSIEESIWDLLGGNATEDDWLKTDFGKVEQHLRSCGKGKTDWEGCSKCKKCREKGKTEDEKSTSWFSKWEDAKTTNEKRLYMILFVFSEKYTGANVSPDGGSETPVEILERKLKAYLGLDDSETPTEDKTK